MGDFECEAIRSAVGGRRGGWSREGGERRRERHAYKMTERNMQSASKSSRRVSRDMYEFAGEHKELKLLDSRDPRYNGCERVALAKKSMQCMMRT
jgi:3-mercaptopyruvate sulfurtransferase SseA